METDLGLLLNVYQGYYILAGVGGLALYFHVAQICRQRLQNYLANPDKSEGMRDLLVGAVVMVACSAEVLFCFSRAASLIQMTM